MAVLEILLGIVIGVPIYDWISITGSAARMTSFDYRYWPPTRLRLASIGLLALGVLTSLMVIRPPDDRWWILLPFAAGVVFHGAVGIADLFRQRREALMTGTSGA